MNAGNALGVDVGGVIIDRVVEDDRVQTAGPRAYAEAAQVEGAFAALARLVQERFRHRVWLVSRCDEPREAVLREWLERQRFFSCTGVPRSQVRFCRERHEKAAVCRQLGISHFIDDRLEVLGHLVGTVDHLYWFSSRASDVERFREVLPHVRPVRGWSDVVDALLRGR